MARATIKVVVPKHLIGKQAVAEKRDGNGKGKVTGLGTHAFAEALLLSNETAKATDDVLAATFAAEFPKRAVHQPIPTWRAYFNGSRHGMNTAAKSSTRYGEDGQPARRAAPKGKGAGEAKGKGKGKGAAKPSKSAKAASKGKPAADEDGEKATE